MILPYIIDIELIAHEKLQIILLILLTLPPVLPPCLIIIPRSVLAFDSILFSTDCPANMTLAELPLVVDGRFNIDSISAIIPSETGTEGKRNGQKQQRNAHQPNQGNHTTPAGAVVYTVVGGSFGIRDPTPTPWCLEAQVMSNDALHRSAGCNAFIEGWNAKAEFHD